MTDYNYFNQKFINDYTFVYLHPVNLGSIQDYGKEIQSTIDTLTGLVNNYIIECLTTLMQWINWILALEA